MTTTKRWFSLAIALTTALVLGLGISIGLADDDAGARLAVLEQPPTLSAPVPTEIGGVPFAMIHDRTDLDARRLARSAAGLSYFVAPGVRPGDVCLLALAGSGAASSTCNPLSVLQSFGAIPLLSFRPDGGISLAAIVPDGATGLRANDGSVGTVESNVLLIDVGPSADSVSFAIAGQSMTLDLGLWKEPLN
jgi:hypothetical protein